MAKLRHIALSVRDAAKAEKFFEQAFGMEKAGEAQRGVYMSDGTVNVALLAIDGRPMGWDKDEPFYGIHHYGLWVDDVEEACKRVEAAGATYQMGEESKIPNAFYEVKYVDPFGNVFDITANGWAGATKELAPSDDPSRGRLRHVALSVDNAEEVQKFFEDAFGMETAGAAGAGVYMTDGTINIALLARKGRPLGWEKDELFYGIDHFGIWVDDIKAARERVEAAGATYVLGNESDDPNTFYEVKYRDPLGHLFDLTATGWKGAVREVKTAGEAAAAAE